MYPVCGDVARHIIFWTAVGSVLAVALVSMTSGIQQPALASMEETSLVQGLKVAPNIVMITLDDVGMNDVGYMSTDIQGGTPVMDSLARDGLRN